MHKLFKKFGSLTLVICTVVALAALPVSAEGGVGYAVDNRPLTDENNNTFFPGFDFEGDSAVFDSLRASGMIRTYGSTLCVHPVRALSKLTAYYDDAAHSTTIERFSEYIGILPIRTTYAINSIEADAGDCDHVYKHGKSTLRYNANSGNFESQNTSVIIVNSGNKVLSSAHVRTMLSTGDFTIGGGNLPVFPSKLGSFDWQGTATIEELLTL